jgi:hypothetical protein
MSTQVLRLSLEQPRFVGRFLNCSFQTLHFESGLGQRDGRKKVQLKKFWALLKFSLRVRTVEANLLHEFTRVARFL